MGRSSEDIASSWYCGLPLSIRCKRPRYSPITPSPNSCKPPESESETMIEAYPGVVMLVGKVPVLGVDPGTQSAYRRNAA